MSSRQQPGDCLHAMVTLSPRSAQTAGTTARSDADSAKTARLSGVKHGLISKGESDLVISKKRPRPGHKKIGRCSYINGMH